MVVRYGKFEIPEKIAVDGESATPTFARFVAEPFERGFGHTVGNSLRRMMLSSLEAPAVVSVRIEGVSHEYMAIQGIVEDMTNIVLNLKGALLKCSPSDAESGRREPRLISSVIEVTADQLKAGQHVVRLGDLIPEGDFSLVNPELPIFSITEPMKRRIDLRVAVGRGYVPSERVTIADKVIDEIIIDALFSPVRLVNYRVENTRVGQDTDYDKLIMEVTTDGRVTPQEALSFAAQIGTTHLAVFEKVESQELTFERGESANDGDREDLLSKLALGIGEIELSVRSTNCLNSAGIRRIGQLVTREEREMLEYRNFGKKSLGEIRDKLIELGLGFNMDLSQYSLNRDNVMEVVEEYLEERKAREAEAEAFTAG